MNIIKISQNTQKKQSKEAYNQDIHILDNYFAQVLSVLNHLMRRENFETKDCDYNKGFNKYRIFNNNYYSNLKQYQTMALP